MRVFSSRRTGLNAERREIALRWRSIVPSRQRRAGRDREVAPAALVRGGRRGEIGKSRHAHEQRRRDGIEVLLSGRVAEHIHGGFLLLAVADQTGQVQVWIPPRTAGRTPNDHRVLQDHGRLFEHALPRQVAGAATISVGKRLLPFRPRLQPNCLLEQFNRLLEPLPPQGIKAPFGQDVGRRCIP
jgi:hypothetical protein